MMKHISFCCLLTLAFVNAWAEPKSVEPMQRQAPPVQVVQLLDLFGITADEVDQFLQKEIMNRGYRVIPMTEKPQDYFVVNILNSNVASGGAVATGLSTVVARYTAKTDQETLVDHSTTVILVSGPDMEESARRQGLKALQAIVEGLDQVLQNEIAR